MAVTEVPAISGGSSISAGTITVSSVTVASSALPTGAATAVKQPALGTAGTPSADVISVQGRTGMTPLDVTAALSATDNAVLDAIAAAELLESVGPTTASVTAVGSSASNVTLLASSATRRGFSIFNDSTAILYVKYGTTASATDWSIKLQAGAMYESFCPVCYTGRIDGIWASANGYARMAEI